MRHDEVKSFTARVHDLWRKGLDTKDMSRELHVHESECEKALHVALSLKRSIAKSLRA
jgi:hypothetical protein